jgi:hypothetical protein
MNSIRSALCFIVLASSSAALGAGDLHAAAAQAVAQDPVVKPWEAQEYPCGWWMDADDGTHRGSIGPGNDGVMLLMSDAAFLGWPDTHGLPVELAFNRDAEDRVKGEAWVTHVAGTSSSMVNIELDAAGLAKLGGATNVMLFRDGRQVFAMDLANTPGADELIACIPSPDRGHGDAES